MLIRPARAEDAEALIAIYAPYVEQTAITFEYDVPTVAEFAERITCISQDYPYLVAEQNGKIVGYAYGSAFAKRAAYHWSVELSIYLDQQQRGQGIGQQLYQQLEQQLAERGMVNLLACIALPNDASIAFHQKRGYQQVAHFPKIGYKFAQWHDIVWLQKRLLVEDKE
ncbi:GNAT family N-acetyltransferase [Volucribacter amazonae]|uniref:Acetyltransferase n=1 Tax=Volucribacter amazonae TaxID=256731 RepID=A0A9X4SI26_9PAST|nr:GNAT family N-acetyltransferase [Volucribacter amazonae]MDG6895227.1 acetyltransferase [Volucribacter amazonae]